jgi:hypothetical protein
MLIVSAFWIASCFVPRTRNDGQKPEAIKFPSCGRGCRLSADRQGRGVVIARSLSDEAIRIVK